MLRAMMLEFPNDPACDYLDLQYMLGDSLLVVPVFSHDGSVNYYVPQGKWTDFANGTVIEGPRWVREAHDFMSLPLLVRPNSVVPIGIHNDKPDYDYCDGVTLQVYQLEDGKQINVEVPALDGTIENKSSPSPRPLDTLEVKVLDDGAVLVKFENYLAGSHEKIVVS